MKLFSGGVRYKVLPIDMPPMELGRLFAIGRFVVPQRHDWSVAHGWARYENFLDSNFEVYSDWILGAYVLLYLRIDTRKVSSALLKANVSERIKAWCLEHGRPKCPKSVRDEIKIGVQENLIVQTTPRIELIPVVWNVNEGWLLLHSFGEKQNVLFQKLFSSSFGQTPMKETLLDAVGDEALEALLDVPASDLRSCAL